MFARSIVSFTCDIICVYVERAIFTLLQLILIILSTDYDIDIPLNSGKYLSGYF